MKKLTAIIIATYLVLLSGCQYNPYSGKTPYELGEAKWVCEEIDAYFVVDYDLRDPEGNQDTAPEGEIIINGEVHPIKLYFFLPTNQVSLEVLKSSFTHVPNDDIGELYGECDFSDTKFTISIDPERDTLFKGEYEKLIFLKES